MTLTTLRAVLQSFAFAVLFSSALFGLDTCYAADLNYPIEFKQPEVVLLKETPQYTPAIVTGPYYGGAINHGTLALPRSSVISAESIKVFASPKIDATEMSLISSSQFKLSSPSVIEATQVIESLPAIELTPVLKVTPSFRAKPVFQVTPLIKATPVIKAPPVFKAAPTILRAGGSSLLSEPFGLKFELDPLPTYDTLSFSSSISGISISSGAILRIATVPIDPVELDSTNGLVVPEPGTTALLLLGLTSIAGFRRRR